MTKTYNEVLMYKLLSEVGNRQLQAATFLAVYEMFESLELPESGFIDTSDAHFLITYPQSIIVAAMEFREIKLRGIPVKVPYSAKSAILAIEIFSHVISSILTLKFERRWEQYDIEEPHVPALRKRNAIWLERVVTLLAGGAI